MGGVTSGNAGFTRPGGLTRGDIVTVMVGSLTGALMLLSLRTQDGMLCRLSAGIRIAFTGKDVTKSANQYFKKVQTYRLI